MEEVEKYSEHYEKIKSIFSENLINKGHKDALLVHELKDYITCMGKIDKEKLGWVLDDDEKFWNKNLENQKEKSNKTSAQIEAFLQES